MAPRISIVTATYNRAHTLGRTIDSVLAQDFQDWELIVVDDGSRDGTRALLDSYHDPRLVTVFHEQNRGVCAAKNSGFDHAQGEWITTLDSDDELVPGALSSLLEVPNKVDPTVDAVSCNCLNSRTGQLTGRGLNSDQYIDLKLSLNLCQGEHWGMFRREILGPHRLNERIFGMEGVLWMRIHENVRWYYLHRGLRIWHTDGKDRITAAKFGNRKRDQRMYQSYAALLDEEADYLRRLHELSPRAFQRTLMNAAGQFLFEGDRLRLELACSQLESAGHYWQPALLRGALPFGPLLRLTRRLASAIVSQ